MNRDKELVKRLAIQKKLEAKYSKLYMAVFKKYAPRVAAVYAGSGVSGAKKSLKGFHDDMALVWEKNVKESAKSFREATLNMISSMLKLGTTDDFDEEIQNYINSYGGDKITSIEDTTVEVIKRIIASGEEDGLPVSVIAKNLRDVIGGELSKHRAMTIAITETHSAAAHASQVTAKATGLKLMKEWVSAEDARTRESHVIANGQKVKMKAKYTVGGHKLAYPGDPNAPASETVRCRCIEIYIEDNS